MGPLDLCKRLHSCKQYASVTSVFCMSYVVVICMGFVVINPVCLIFFSPGLQNVGPGLARPKEFSRGGLRAGLDLGPKPSPCRAPPAAQSFVRPFAFCFCAGLCFKLCAHTPSFCPLFLLLGFMCVKKRA